MRIIIAYRYYWPDTPPYAAILRSIASWLAEAGHEVTVITAQPGYKPEVAVGQQPWREVAGGVRIERVRLLRERGSGMMKLANAALFICKAGLRILSGPRPDVVMCNSTPPVGQAMIVSAAGRLRGAKFVYHIQDIYPEIGIASGSLKEGPFTRLLKRIDRFTLRRTDAAVVLGEDMTDAIAARGVSPKHTEIINNFSLALADQPDRLRTREPGRPARFVFAGNIGRFQNLEALVSAFGALEPGIAELEMLGDGKAKPGLIEICRKQGITNVRFHGHMPVEDAFRFMQACDFGVVSLTPGIYRYAYPSKTLTYLAAGLPMLAMVEEQSALARMVEEGGFGKAVSWDRGPEAIAGAVKRLAVAEGARDIAEAARPIYHPEAAKARWLGLFGKLAGGDRR